MPVLDEAGQNLRGVRRLCVGRRRLARSRMFSSREEAIQTSQLLYLERYIANRKELEGGRIERVTNCVQVGTIVDTALNLVDDGSSLDLMGSGNATVQRLLRAFLGLSDPRMRMTQWHNTLP
jgi:hypothetical protein